MVGYLWFLVNGMLGLNSKGDWVVLVFLFSWGEGGIFSIVLLIFG